MSALGPAGLAVVHARLAGIAEEVGVVLRRAAFSPNIKERADCSAALFSAQGELLVQAEHIPVHLGAMPAAVAAAIAECGGAVGPDDQIVVNDPFAGGTHLNDVTFVAPVFAAGGTLVGWVANRAHHADIGGTVPGSMPPDARHIDEEGLRLPPMVWSAAVRDEFLRATRTPRERAGDLEAQLGANRVGARALQALAARTPAEHFVAVLDYGERRMRAALTAMPDGVVRAEDVLDSTGASGDNRRPARVALTLEKSGSEVVFDFTASDDQRAGNVNAVEAVTVSCVAFALRCATDPSIPANGGSLRPVSVRTRPGSIVAARAPAAVAAGNVEVSQRVADVALAALRGLVPGRIGAAGQGTMNNLILGAPSGHPDPWVYYETIGGGQGARPGRAGMSAVHTGMTNTHDTPVEALERSLPVRVRRYGIARGSGGAGRFAGGDGIVKEYELLSDATLTLITERRISSPPGADGGAPGAPGENWLLPGGRERDAERLPDKVTRELRRGDVVRVVTPGGGGLGAP